MCKENTSIKLGNYCLLAFGHLPVTFLATDICYALIDQHALDRGSAISPIATLVTYRVRNVTGLAVMFKENRREIDFSKIV